MTQRREPIDDLLRSIKATRFVPVKSTHNHDGWGVIHTVRTELSSDAAALNPSV